MPVEKPDSEIEDEVGAPRLSAGEPGENAGESEGRKLLTIGVSPHIRDSDTTTRIMGWVIIALLPIAVYGIYIGGIRAFVVVAMSVAGAVAAEAFIQHDEIVSHMQIVSHGVSCTQRIAAVL